MYVIVIGRPDRRPGRICGVTGPFDTKDKALSYADTHFKNRLFAVVKVEKPINKPRFWNIESDTELNKEYVVRLSTDGKWTCQCKDHMFRDRDCKHILQAQAEFYGYMIGN